jgi:DNA-binding IclR family transcriptional regulator
MARSSSGQSVLERVVLILGAFEQGGPALPVSEIARRTGLPTATAHRLVTELVATGMLERGADRRIRVGLRLWEIASRAPRALGLREAALPYMENLQAATRQHTQLGVLDGTEVLFIERLSAPNSVVNVTRIGGRIPLHASSAGLVLLAHADPGFQERILAAPLRRFTDGTPTDPRRLRTELAGIRRRHHVVCPGFIHADAMGIAVPVFGPDDAVVAALSLVVPNTTTDPRLYVSGLQTAAHGIGRSVGRGPAGAVGADPTGEHG